MSIDLASVMRRALEHTRAQNLNEATAEIQAALAGHCPFRERPGAAGISSPPASRAPFSVLDLDADAVLGLRSPNDNVAVGARELDRVLHEIRQCRLQQLCVRLDGEAGLHLELDRNPSLDDRTLRDVFDELANIDGGVVECLARF